MKCHEKTPYSTKRDAKRAVQRCRVRFRRGFMGDMTANELHRMMAYRCHECGYWHIGKRSVMKNIIRSRWEYIQHTLAILLVS